MTTVVSVFHNDVDRLPFFIAHHRQLGAEAFIIIDNASTDGLREQCSRYRDCDYVFVGESYSSDRRRAWLEQVFNERLVGKWIVSVDSDELFFPPASQQSLPELVASLESEDADGLFSTTVDFYPADNVFEAKIAPGEPPWIACPYYDRGPYLEWPTQTGLPNRIYCGVRQRVFWSNSSRPVRGLERSIIKRLRRVAARSGPRKLVDYADRRMAPPPAVHKMPLIRWQSSFRHITSHELDGPRPSKLLGWIFHFKFEASFYKKIETAIKKENYANNSLEYKAYKSKIAKMKSGLYSPEISQKFVDFDQFITDFAK